MHTGCVEPHASRTTDATVGMRHQNKVLCGKEPTVEGWETASRVGRAPSVTVCFANWESLDIPGREAPIGERNAKVTRSTANLRLKAADIVGRGRPGQGRFESVQEKPSLSLPPPIDPCALRCSSIPKPTYVSKATICACRSVAVAPGNCTGPRHRYRFGHRHR